MGSLKERIQSRVEEVRERRPFVDHLVRMVQHNGKVKGSQQAGAVTYFGFISFFPVLALAFAVVGFIASGGPDVEKTLVDAIEGVLPGIVSTNPEDVNAIQLSDIEDAAPGILSIGLPVLLYSGLGWLSAMRDALLTVFETPLREQPNFVIGKLRDLISLFLIGVTLVVSVAIAGVVTGFSREILEFVGLEDSTPAGWLLGALTVVVGLAANALLFYALFRLLAAPELPQKALWSGAVLGAVGFEALKQLSWLLLDGTKEQPAFQAFGIALILVVWINYFSKLVVFAGAWAYTSPSALEQQEIGHERQSERDALAGPPEAAAAARRTAEGEALQPAAAFALGSATMLGVVALARKTVRRGRGE
jgi:membrane protein